MWTAWTRSGLVLSEWLQSYGKRKQRRCWIRTPHWLPLKAVGLLVSSLGAQARFTLLSCKAYFSSSLHMRSTAMEHLTHPPFALCLLLPSPSFSFCWCSSWNIPWPSCSAERLTKTVLDRCVANNLYCFLGEIFSESFLILSKVTSQMWGHCSYFFSWFISPLFRFDWQLTLTDPF